MACGARLLQWHAGCVRHDVRFYIIPSALIATNMRKGTLLGSSKPILAHISSRITMKARLGGFLASTCFYPSSVVSRSDQYLMLKDPNC